MKYIVRRKSSLKDNRYTATIIRSTIVHTSINLILVSRPVLNLYRILGFFYLIINKKNSATRIKLSRIDIRI